MISHIPIDDDDDLPQLLFGFGGRIARKAFWLYGVLGVLLVQSFADLLLQIAGFSDNVADTASTVLIAWPSLALTIKRWHDRDKSGWWVLIVVVPVVGMLWTLVQCGCLRGTPGTNRFGPAPGTPRATAPRAELLGTAGGLQ